MSRELWSRRNVRCRHLFEIIFLSGKGLLTRQPFFGHYFMSLKQQKYHSIGKSCVRKNVRV